MNLPLLNIDSVPHAQLAEALSQLPSNFRGFTGEPFSSKCRKFALFKPANLGQLKKAIAGDNVLNYAKHE